VTWLPTPGEKIYIRYNPHRRDGSNTVGVVERVDVGTGFGGCDLVYVRWIDPWTGEEDVFLFATYNLWGGTREEVIAAAERMERQAAMLREIASHNRQ
jgi:hypothetical protein